MLTCAPALPPPRLSASSSSPHPPSRSASKLETIDLRGLDLKLPHFPHISIPSLDLHLPHFELPKLGGGGGFSALLDKLSGLLKLELDFSKLLKAVEVKDYDVNFVDGKAVGSAAIDVDIGKVFKFLTGKVHVFVDSAAKDVLTIKCEGIRLANPALQDWIEVGFDYVGGAFSGSAKFKKTSGKLQGFDVSLLENKIAFHDGDFSGFAKLGAGKAGTGSGEVTVTYANGELDLAGNTTIEAASITGGYLTGVLKASNEHGTKLSGKINIAKGPLVGMVKDIDASYDNGELEASFTLGKPLIAKLATVIPGITLTPNDTPIQIKSHGGALDITGEIGGAYTIPGLMTGTFKAGLKKNVPHAELTITALDEKLEIPGATLDLTQFLLLLDEHLVPSGGHHDIGVDIKGLVKGKLHLDIKGGKLGGFDFSGELAETALTQPIKKLGIKYDGHGWSGETQVRFKALGNLLDEGAALTLAGSSTGFALSAKNVVFTKGLLEGFRVDEAHLTDAGFGGTIGAGGHDLMVGSIKAHVAGGSVTFDDKGFVKGDVKGDIDFTDKLKVGFDVKATGTHVSIDVATTTPINLSDLSPAIQGKATASYVDNKFKFTATDVHFTDPRVKDLASITRFEYHNGAFDLAIHVNPGEFKFAPDKPPAQVQATTLQWDKGLIDGEIVARVDKLVVKAGWKHGVFFLGAGGELDLKTKFPAIFSSGKVQAEGDTSGKASFKVLEKIKLIKLPALDIHSLAGDIEHLNVSLGVHFDPALINLPGVQLKNVSADAKLKYNEGKLEVDGKITGGATVHAGGKDVVSGRFEVFYGNDAFGGNVHVDKVSLSEKYLSPKGTFLIGFDPWLKTPTASGAIHFKAPHIAEGDIFVKPNDVDLRTGKLDFAADVGLLPEVLEQFKLHVEHKDGDIKAGVQTAGSHEVNVGGAQLTIGQGSNLAFDSATGQVTGRVVGAARVGKIATGTFDLGFNGTDLDGNVKAKIAKMPLFQEGFDLDIGIKKGMLSTQGEEIEIALEREVPQVPRRQGPLLGHQQRRPHRRRDRRHQGPRQLRQERQGLDPVQRRDRRGQRHRPRAARSGEVPEARLDARDLPRLEPRVRARGPPRVQGLRRRQGQRLAPVLVGTRQVHDQGRRRRQPVRPRRAVARRDAPARTAQRAIRAIRRSQKPTFASTAS